MTTSTSTSASVLTALLASLSTIKPTNSIPPGPSKSILSTLTGQDLKTAKAALLTLHFLFPHELLPALDLLDRNLVNRLTYRVPSQLQVAAHDAVASGTENLERKDAEIEVFYIQSASAVTESKGGGTGGSGRFRNAWKGRWNATKVYYEVRLDAWNCSCAAFAQSAMKLVLNESRPSSGQGVEGQRGGDMEMDMEMKMPEKEVDTDVEGKRGYVFGGKVTNTDLPIPTCKHILAAAIGMAAPEVFGGVQSREVSGEELAGWAAGWGEG